MITRHVWSRIYILLLIPLINIATNYEYHLLLLYYDYYYYYHTITKTTTIANKQYYSTVMGGRYLPSLPS